MISCTLSRTLSPMPRTPRNSLAQLTGKASPRTALAAFEYAYCRHFCSPCTCVLYLSASLSSWLGFGFGFGFGLGLGFGLALP